MTRSVVLLVLVLLVVGVAGWFLTRPSDDSPARVQDVGAATGRSESDAPAPLPSTSDPTREVAPPDMPVPTDETAAVRTGIAGTVLDPDGKPVNGGTVEVFFPRRLMMFQEDLGPVVSQASTDAEGKFLVALRTGTDRAMVMAHGKGGARVEKDGIAVDEGAITTIAPIRLNRSAGFSGHVRSQDGAPIAGATLRIGHRPEDRMHTASEPNERTVTSGKDGEYLAEGLLAGTKDVTVRAEGFANGGQAGIIVPEGKVTAGIDFTLRPQMTISGVVRTGAGDPLAGVKIEGYRHDPADDVPESEEDEEEEDEDEEVGSSVEVSIESWGECVSAADGTFTITGLEKDIFDLVARKDEFDVWQSGQPIASGTKDVSVTMTANPWLRGHVVDGVTGKPVANFTVAVGRMIEPNGGTYLRRGIAVNDADGRFATNDAPAGRWYVRVLSPGYATCDAGPFAVPSPTGEDIEIRLLRGTRVIGSVRSESSRLPLPGVKLRLQPASGNTKIGSVNAELAPEARATTDENGKFVFEHVGDGSYSVALLTSKFVARGKTGFELPPSHEALELPVLDLCRSGWITGNARDGKKKTRGLSNVVVLAESGKTRKIGMTGPDGRYRISPLPFGEYTVRIVRFEPEKEGETPQPGPSKTVSVFEGQESVLDLE